MKPNRQKIDLVEITYEALDWFFRYVVTPACIALGVVLVAYNCFIR